MFVTQKRILGFKTEGTPYNAETLTGADFDTRVRDITYSPEVAEYKRKYATGDFAYFASVKGKRTGTFSFTVDLAYSGNDTTAPKWGDLLEMCGFSETITSVVEYKLDSTKDAVPGTFEIREREDEGSTSQLTIKFSGCMGTVQFVLDEVGQPIKANFTFTGALISIEDDTGASIVVPSGFDTTCPDAVLSSTVVFDSVAQDIDSMTIDVANDVQLVTDPSRTQGVRGAQIVGREPTITFDPYLDSIADEDHWTRLNTTCVTGEYRITAGSNLQLTAHKVQLISAYDGADRNGVTVNTLNGILTRTSETDETELTIRNG